jgi:hypothetical protein
MTLPLYKRSKLRNAGEWYFLESIVIGPHENPREKIAGLKANRSVRFHTAKANSSCRHC